MALSAVITPDLSGNPSVTLDISGVTGDRITVSRQWEGESATVRGMGDAPTLGSVMVVEDAEVPFGVPVSWMVVCRTTSGSVVEQWQTPPVTVDVAEVWVSDPLAPGSAAAVTLSGTSLSSVTFGAPVEVRAVVGSSLPVAVSGTRQSASGVPLAFWCRSDAERVAALAVLRTASPFLLRVPPTIALLPALAYLVAPDVSVVDLTYSSGGDQCRIEMQVTQVAPPNVDAVVPDRTYEDVLAGASTYGDLLTQFATYADLLKG